MITNFLTEKLFNITMYSVLLPELLLFFGLSLFLTFFYKFNEYVFKNVHIKFLITTKLIKSFLSIGLVSMIWALWTCRFFIDKIFSLLFSLLLLFVFLFLVILLFSVLLLFVVNLINYNNGVCKKVYYYKIYRKNNDTFNIVFCFNLFSFGDNKLYTLLFMVFFVFTCIAYYNYHKSNKQLNLLKAYKKYYVSGFRLDPELKREVINKINLEVNDSWFLNEEEKTVMKAKLEFYFLEFRGDYSVLLEACGDYPFLLEFPILIESPEEAIFRLTFGQDFFKLCNKIMEGFFYYFDSLMRFFMFYVSSFCMLVCLIKINSVKRVFSTSDLHTLWINANVFFFILTFATFLVEHLYKLSKELHFRQLEYNLNFIDVLRFALYQAHYYYLFVGVMWMFLHFYYMLILWLPFLNLTHVLFVLQNNFYAFWLLMQLGLFGLGCFFFFGFLQSFLKAPEIYSTFLTLTWHFIYQPLFTLYNALYALLYFIKI